MFFDNTVAVSAFYLACSNVLFLIWVNVGQHPEENAWVMEIRPIVSS